MMLNANCFCNDINIHGKIISLREHCWQSVGTCKVLAGNNMISLYTNDKLES